MLIRLPSIDHETHFGIWSRYDRAFSRACKTSHEEESEEMKSKSNKELACVREKRKNVQLDSLNPVKRHRRHLSCQTEPYKSVQGSTSWSVLLSHSPSLSVLLS